ncbi:Fcf2-domain-containing protein [Calocera cornea HHB12733]|uniref:Fcf2-domain-containing protein n=1 Tax=Calocera cornea HHB12733 TaxID=1353952 RepID=A0A165I4W2_9BASI|nr:Fcf2-domain-containing protein [Calocera cornea HHB12733]
MPTTGAAEASSAVAGPSSPKIVTPDIHDFIEFPQSDEGNDAVEAEEEDNDETEDSSEEDSEESEEDEDDTGAESDNSVTSERLNALLEKAREKERQWAAEKANLDEDVVKLSDDRPLPKLDVSSLLPKPYFTTPTSKQEPAKLAIDPGMERVTKAAQKRKAEPEPERLTKKQRRELREKTAGPEWFDMPTPSGTELAKIKREMEAARLAAALDPKTFLRKEAMKEEVPKYVQLGKIVATKTPFETRSNKNLTRAERKKSIVDELVEDAEAKSYAKRKFLDLQGVRGERGKLTMRRRKEMKAARRKW